MGQNSSTLVNPKINCKWIFITVNAVMVGFEPSPYTYIYIMTTGKSTWDTILEQCDLHVIRKVPICELRDLGVPSSLNLQSALESLVAYCRSSGCILLGRSHSTKRNCVWDLFSMKSIKSNSNLQLVHIFPANCHQHSALGVGLGWVTTFPDFDGWKTWSSPNSPRGSFLSLHVGQPPPTRSGAAPWRNRPEIASQKASKGHGTFKIFQLQTHNHPEIMGSGNSELFTMNMNIYHEFFILEYESFQKPKMGIRNDRTINALSTPGWPSKIYSGLWMVIVEKSIFIWWGL